MLVLCTITPSSMSLAPIYTPGWRGTMWGNVSCLRKQHDGRDWALNHRPSDLKSNALTTTFHLPVHIINWANSSSQPVNLPTCLALTKPWTCGQEIRRLFKTSLYIAHHLLFAKTRNLTSHNYIVTHSLGQRSTIRTPKKNTEQRHMD